ncbi:MAG: hypothetical protein K9M55_07375 [Candidatus Marinimicrobia bacterium]|nr:hypothetical protein [Candidatus Neomarinimicrobiota bacterium]
MGPGDWGGNLEAVDWAITLDSGSSSSTGQAVQINTLHNGYIILYHYVLLPDGEGVHSLKLSGTCHVDYDDSTHYPNSILAESTNFWLSKLDSTGYWKEKLWGTVTDTTGSEINHYGIPIYEFKNPDTSFTVADTMGSFIWNDFGANSLVKPFGNGVFLPDSIENFVLEVDLPAAIKGDTVSLSITPKPDVIFRPGEKTLLLQKGVFTLIFQ